MGSLDDRLRPERLELTAEQTSAMRRRGEQLLGFPLPISAHERALYEAEGKAPPTR